LQNELPRREENESLTNEPNPIFCGTAENTDHTESAAGCGPKADHPVPSVLSVDAVPSSHGVGTVTNPTQTNRTQLQPRHAVKIVAPTVLRQATDSSDESVFLQNELPLL
jgi:hypothetical protein